MELFKKIYIRSKADLPKEEGYYFIKFKQKGDPKIYADTFASHYFGEGDKRDAVWLDCIDWYLQPITLPTEEELNDLFTYKKPYKVKSDELGEAQIYFAFSEDEKEAILKFYEWLINKITGNETQ